MGVMEEECQNPDCIEFRLVAGHLKPTLTHVINRMDRAERLVFQLENALGALLDEIREWRTEIEK